MPESNRLLDHIREQLAEVLSTPIGDRLHRPAFWTPPEGCHRLIGQRWPNSLSVAIPRPADWISVNLILDDNGCQIVDNSNEPPSFLEAITRAADAIARAQTLNDPYVVVEHNHEAFPNILAIRRGEDMYVYGPDGVSSKWHCTRIMYHHQYVINFEKQGGRMGNRDRYLNQDRFYRACESFAKINGEAPINRPDNHDWNGLPLEVVFR